LYAPGKKSKFPVFIILLLTSISSGFADYVKTVDQVEITGNLTDSSIVNFLANVAEKGQKELDAFFVGKIKTRVQVRLAETADAYLSSAGSNVPDWSGAVAFPGKREILLKPGSYFDPETYQETLIHELVHIYIADNFNNRDLPLWINEGCAMHLSKPALTWNEMIVLGNAFSNERIVGFEAVDDLLRFGPAQAHLAYLQSFSAVRYLIEEFGNQKFRLILQNCTVEPDLNQIFYDQLDIGLSEFEDEWYLTMQERLRWVIFLQVENLLWLSLVVISVAVFIIIRLRNRKTVKNWQKTDDYI